MEGTLMKKLTFVTVLVAALLAFVGYGTGVGAQSTPASPGAGPASHPAHIHDGACPEVGDVVYPLNDLLPTGEAATPEAAESLALASTPAATPFAGGEVVAASTTDVDASLDEILSAERAINVHLSPELIQEYIACGDLTGEPANGELMIQLAELNDSGFVGEARLVDNGDGTTTVTVSLMLSEGEATPAG